MNENSPVVGVIDEGSSIRESLSNLLRSAELRNFGRQAYHFDCQDRKDGVEAAGLKNAGLTPIKKTATHSSAEPKNLKSKILYGYPIEPPLYTSP